MGVSPEKPKSVPGRGYPPWFMKGPLGVVDIVFTCTTAVTLGALAVTRVIAPAFVDMFRDFGGELPRITRWAIEPEPTMVVALVVVSLLGLGLWRRRPVLLVIATALAALAVAGFFWGMYAPIWELAGAVRQD